MTSPTGVVDLLRALRNGGKFGPEVERLLLELQANGIILVVAGGPRGPGFSVAVTDPALLFSLPRVLRETADTIERQRRAVTDG